MSSDQKPWVIIGTSGSADYLHDKTGDRRFWKLGPPKPKGSLGELPAVLRWLLEIT